MLRLSHYYSVGRGSIIVNYKILKKKECSSEIISLGKERELIIKIKNRFIHNNATTPKGEDPKRKTIYYFRFCNLSFILFIFPIS